jgi:hypothetical protein
LANLSARALTGAALVAALATLAAGCGSAHLRKTVTQAAPGAGTKCTLSAKQRRVIRRSKHMIVRMHRLEQPLKTVREHGPMTLELLLNRFLLTIGVLPVNERALLIRQAKSAVGLCRDCFDALEAEEPAVGTRLGESTACAGGF